MTRYITNRTPQIFLVALACSATLLALTSGTGQTQRDSAEQILQSYVADFRQDPAAEKPFTFGVRVTGDDGGDWHVVVGAKKEGQPAATVTLHAGFPEQPIPYYTLDLATLRKLHRGQMNALTAMVKARPTDQPPMDFAVTPGFEPPPDFLADFLPLTFHFWTRGLPERVPFNGDLSRECHGANTVGFYYQKGFRSGWFQVRQGQHVNQDPQDQTNPFPSMFIMLSGKLEAKIGGKQLTFPAREMMLVPPGVTHEFWNPYAQPAEFIILMFGEGA